jgi:tRNA(fMet)-specific endonuclease VapC
VARRVILDTGVLIAIERGKLDVDAVLGADDAAIAAITAMELLVGVERADEAHRQARAIRVEAILSSLPIEPYNVGIARVHARLAVEAMAKGRARSANDMMIAATAASTSRILLTTDASAGFDQLTGVRAEVLKLPSAQTDPQITTAGGEHRDPD